MNGNDLINLISDNAGTVLTSVGSIAGAIFTAIFLRNNVATKEFEKIKAGKLGEVAEDLLKTGDMSHVEFYKTKNFLKIAEKADKLYSNTHSLRGEMEYSFDWFIRFYEAASNISDEQLQSIWAKILAREIDMPNTYSLRLIDVLKNLSKNEAELFERVCSKCVYDGNRVFLPNYKEYLDEVDVSYSDVLFLSELGLLIGDNGLVFKKQVGADKEILFASDRRLICASTNNMTDMTVEIKAFPLTRLGNELSTLIKAETTNESFTLFAKVLNKNTLINYYLYEILQRNGDQYEYDDNNILETHD